MLDSLLLLLFCIVVSLLIDIEELTSKTGNFREFPVFVQMVACGLTGDVDSVFIDLLTYADMVQFQR